MADSINWSDSAEESDVEKELHSKLDNRRCIYCFKILKCSSVIPEHIKVCEVAIKSSARLVSCKNGLQKFICDICCRTFKYLRYLAEHEKRHEPPGNFSCKYCIEKFCTEAEREKHTEDKHKVFKCLICKSILQTAENYIEHIKTLHNGQNREYKACNDCGRLYSSSLILKYHQDTNCGLNGIYKCDQCKKSFQTKGRLKIHKLTHSGEKNFCCSYCGQKFRHFMHLQSHEFKHTGKKPYQCNICQKSFSHRASLSTHSTTHTGLKPYLCEYCGSRFSCASNIIQHRKKRPDTCGLPQYCTKLTKACPIANLKNLNLLTSEAPIKIFKSVKVIKENEIKPKNWKNDENSSNHDNIKKGTNCFECTDQVFKKTYIYIKHLRDYHNKSNDEINKLLGANNLNCYICGKIYKMEKNLEKHLKTHCTNKIDDNISIETRDLKTDLENMPIQNNVKDFQSEANKTFYLDEIKSEVVSESDSKNIRIETIPNIAQNDKFQIKTETLEDPLKNETLKKINLNNSINLDNEVNVNFSSKVVINKRKLITNNSLSDSKTQNSSDNDDSRMERIKIACFECDNQIFTQKSLFIRHLRSGIHNKSEEDIEKLLTSLNNGKKNSKCHICGKLYSIPFCLKKHLKTHDQSNNSMENNHNLKTTIESLSNGRKLIRCYKCVDEIFYFKSVYIRHLRSRHHNKTTEEIDKILNELKDNKSNDLIEQNNHQENELTPKETAIEDSKIKSIRCAECNDVFFSRKDEYIRHLRDRHNRSEDEIEKIVENLNGNHRPNLKCNICGKLYTIHYYLKKHLKGHDKEKDFLKTKSLHSNVEYSSAGKKIIHCYKCKDQVFTQKCLYIRHLRGRHHNKSEQEIEDLLKVLNGNEPNLKCKICGKIYSIPYYLKKHLKSHGINATHKCKFCDEYFSTVIEVLKHTQSEHKDQLKCAICDKIFYDFDALMRHNQFVHSNKEKKQFICIKCGKTTSSKIALNDHELSNCGQNPIYRCDVCGKGLSTAGILKAHMMLHTNSFPYKCSYCEKGFRFNDKLKVHLRSHTGEKPFKCPYCDKAFGHSSTLYIHVSTHTGIKRYMCTTCSNRFSCISGLKAHWRTHPTTCGADPNRTTKPQVFMGYRKGKLVNKKDIID